MTVLENKITLPKFLKITILNSSTEFGHNMQNKYNKKYYCNIKNINNNKSFNITFHDSVHNYENNVKLNKNDVVYSVLMDASCYESTSDFEDFCNCFGYDTDSRTAYRAHKGCKKQYINICNTFSNEELEELQTIFENY